jgi:hypothetical protein
MARAQKKAYFFGHNLVARQLSVKFDFCHGGCVGAPCRDKGQVSDSTKSKAAGSLSALCPRLDAVTTNDSEGSASVALIVAPALAARATATTRMRKILPIQIAPSPIYYGLNRSVSSSTAKNATVKIPAALKIATVRCAKKSHRPCELVHIETSYTGTRSRKGPRGEPPLALTTASRSSRRQIRQALN